MDNATYNSGDVGYCEYIGRPRGLIISWNAHTVIDVNCEYKTCGHASYCKLYKRHPVGFVQTFPQSEDSK